MTTLREAALAALALVNDTLLERTVDTKRLSAVGRDLEDALDAEHAQPVAWIKDTSLIALKRDESTVMAYPHDYLIRPAVPPPSCGWPLVVFVHPFGQTRADDIGMQMAIAGQGYAVWGYDVRGQGQAFGANPTHVAAGSTLWGAVERCDLAEQIQFVGSNVMLYCQSAGCA